MEEEAKDVMTGAFLVGFFRRKGEQEMPADVEIELKLGFPEDWLGDEVSRDPLVQKYLLPGSEKVADLETIYYDTPTFALKNHGLSYRIRCRENDWLATIKGDGTSMGGLHCRSEWSVPVKSAEADLAPFCKLPVSARLAEIRGRETLQELFRTRFRRRCMELVTGKGTRLELAVDTGEITVADKKSEIREIELELRKGSISELLRLAAGLAEKYPLWPETRSKYFRGLLLTGQDTAVEETTIIKPVINPLEAAGEVLSKVMCAGIQKALHTLSEYKSAQQRIGLHSIFASEVLHLFSLWKLGRTLINSKEYPAGYRELKRLAKEVLPLWETGQLLKSYQEYNSFCSGGGKRLLEECLRQKEQIAQTALDKSISGGRCVPVLLELWSRLLEDPWSKQDLPPSISIFATKRLSLELKELSQRGVFLASPVSLPFMVRLRAVLLLFSLQEFGAVCTPDDALLKERHNAVEKSLELISSIATITRLISRIEKKDVREEAAGLAGFLSERLKGLQGNLLR